MQNDEICEIDCIHTEILAAVKAKMPDDASLAELADFFKIFSDQTRVKIIWALSISEMCVCNIAALLSMSHSSISHQLRLLKSSKIVKNRRDGKMVYCSLADEHISQIFKQALIHIKE
ncbi:metalloregulator ArsR/SmtB family transcription factor [Campylobacter sp. 9BO]|uniref:ArsR/SmtB family transcription factor n=1 Tax=Campylobacter sp. 9BO TaxID=3424759 RepID=UPI003D3359E1